MKLDDLKYSNYPNPRFRRKSFTMLNGEWDFAFVDNFKVCDTFDKKIIVPYPYESLDSGIGDEKNHNYMVYRRYFDIDELCHYILHFEGVDYMCNIFVNGYLVGSHTGCYSAFCFHLFDQLKMGKNELIVLVYDSFSKHQLRGKQRVREENYECWYTQYSGIYKDVYLEKCGDHPISSIKCSGAKDGTFEYDVKLYNPANIDIIISRLGKTIKTINLHENRSEYIGKSLLNDVDFYDEDTPNLYDVRVISYGSSEDIVDTYFGFRTIETRNRKIYINDKETYLKMILNQGYYGSKLVSGTKEEIFNDLCFIKEAGFNGVRVHQKIESNIFYYIADCFGLYLWNEIPSAYEFNKEMREEYVRELPRLIAQNYNSPSVIVHLLFNECWGVYKVRDDIETQDFIHRMNSLCKENDNTRLVISNDGWFQLSDTDIVSLHEYEQNHETLYKEYKDLNHVLDENNIINTFGPAMADNNPYLGQPIILSEFGGAAMKSSNGWGYGDKCDDIIAYKKQLENIFDVIYKLDYLSGYCYTQLCDVQQEVNGLMDEKRHLKLSIEEYRKIIGRKE